jgi:hypothetical protein
MKASMDAKQIDILAGKASPCVAKCLLTYEGNYLIENYIDGWQQAGLVLPVL